MTRENSMKRKQMLVKPVRVASLPAAAMRAMQRIAAVTLLGLIAACTAGGPATSVLQQTTPGSATASTYTGPAAANADVAAFQINLWNNIRASNRCGGCHHENGQSPMFARSDDVNLAYQAANPLVNFQSPAKSTLVMQVGGGHNCWVADPSVCADTMTTWIQNWIGAGAATATAITLTPPPSQAVGAGKLFPSDPTSFENLIWTPILKPFCSGCHRSNAAVPQQPYFASDDPNEAYVAAQSKIDLNTPANSRFVVRLGTEFHNCWATTPGGSADCAGSAAAMLAAITAFATPIAVTPVDPSLVLSKALALTQGTVSSGSSRYESSIIAKYEFKTGTGTTAYDTSGVDPAADLQLSGNVSWVGGWGITLNTGATTKDKAQASTAASAKIASMVLSTGEYSFEAWAAPANVAQMNANIVSYSGSAKTRNATLGQHMMQYEGYTRSDQTSPNGQPPLQTAAANMNAQAALQHIVLTYDAVNGQKLYVNGVYTGDVDPKKGGSLASWDNTFALVLGNEVSADRPFAGVIKFAAVYNRALTPAQIMQNFNAGVGEQYALLFDVTTLSGVPQSYIMLTGSQYDSYSYLFTNPTFISLNPNAAPANVVVKGMRIGINGAEAIAGQSYATLNVTLGTPAFKAGSGQVMSSVGAVIGAMLGPTSDMFFLSFDQFGSFTHVHTDPVAITPTPVDNPAAPDVGVKPFAQINASLAAITGVSANTPVVNALYNTLQQSLPPSPQINAFLGANETAIAQLADQYCTTLMGNASSVSNFFGASVAANLNTAGAAFFGTGTANVANRMLIVKPLITGCATASACKAAVVGNNVNAMTAAAITQEIGGIDSSTNTQIGNATIYNNSLITKLASTTSDTVGTIAKASCTAVLGSAAVSVQ